MLSRYSHQTASDFKRVRAVHAVRESLKEDQGRRGSNRRPFYLLKIVYSSVNTAVPLRVVPYEGPCCTVPADAYGLGPAGFRGLILTPAFEAWVEAAFPLNSRGDRPGTTFVMLRSSGGYIFHEFQN